MEKWGLCFNFLQSAFQVSVAANQHLIAQDLLSLGAQVNTTDCWGRTPVHVCAEKGHTLILQVRPQPTQSQRQSHPFWLNPLVNPLDPYWRKAFVLQISVQMHSYLNTTQLLHTTVPKQIFVRILSI